MFLNYISSVAVPATVSISPFYAFAQSDFIGKTIVIILFIGSIYIWTIMIEKWSYLSKTMKAAKRFKETFRKTKYPLSIYAAGEKEISPLGDVYLKASDELLSYYNLSKENAGKYGTQYFPQQKLTIGQIETIRSMLEQSVSDKILELEDKMGFLATAVSVSPFFGLLGTVWGVMMAFISMAVQGKAQISGMAPGISGALLTTVVGLLVAIPSLIGYNFLSNYIKQLTVYMDNFVEEFMSKVKLEQYDI
ncbi:MAG TPA: MotA/TolQ/ExbB proton channel family protein [Victivallales bacterium]|nr:MotA/TolQ/ExbB proton channel family protein [Victivallales bacterium]